MLGEIPWQQHDITLYGRTLPQPRLIAWIGDGPYRYSGRTYAPGPWTPTLLAVKREVEATVGRRFDAVLCNRYRDGRDSMGRHADDEPELGPVIASVSLGAMRTFVLRRRKEPHVHRLALAHGSLLVMAGDTQRDWTHALPRTTRPVGERINLTFRTLLEEGPHPPIGLPRSRR